MALFPAYAQGEKSDTKKDDNTSGECFLSCGNAFSGPLDFFPYVV